MIIYPTQSQPNNLVTQYMNQRKVAPPLIQSSNVQKKPEKKTNAKKLYWVLGALALVIVAILSYKKLTKVKAIKNNSNAPSNPFTQNMTSLENYIGNFSQEMSNIEKCKFNEKLGMIDLTKFRLINYLQEDALSPLKCLYAATKAKLERFMQLPPIFSLNNVSHSETKDVARILSSMFELNFASTRYTRGHMKEFVESLEEFSANSVKKFNKEQSHTLLHFDNASEFLADLNKPGNEGYKLRFDNLIRKNAENKVTYVIDENASKRISSDFLVTLNFDKKINRSNLKPDLEESGFQLGHKLISQIKDIENKLSQYIYPNPDLFFILRSLMLDKPTKNIVLIEGQNQRAIDKVIYLISSRTGNALEKIECSGSLEDLIAVIIQKGKQSEELYSRTGKRTFLYLDNIEQVLSSKVDTNSPAYKALKEFIKNSGKRHHAITVVNAKTSDSKVKELISENNKLFKLKLFDEKMIQKYRDAMLEKMEKNDFSHIDQNRFIREFVDLLAAERAGKSESSEQIANGILLYGAPDNITRITANAIKNSIDVHYVKITFNKNEPLKSLGEMIENAEKAEKLYKQTGKRTILEFDKLDKLLTDKDNLQVAKIIGRFKGFVEHISRDYHTTVLMRTSRPLNDFEAASIASHRFDLKLRNS